MDQILMLMLSNGGPIQAHGLDKVFLMAQFDLVIEDLANNASHIIRYITHKSKWGDNHPIN